ncbi:MAG: LPS biosynthesis glycosyltransferase [Candidatus Electrothrix sp. GM3_4]|nr:LPS biosynthesis glycosyltransferase [Candidatus Electrothrix sp. GM3_4]
MDKSTNCFDRIYVINLPERTDRLREVTAALERIGVSFAPGKVELFPAVKPTDAAGFPSPGVRGCFLSHLSVLKKASELDLPSVLVLEDDVEFAGVSQRVWTSILQQLNNQPWNFVYLGYTHVDSATRATRGAEQVEMIPFPGSLRCAHAYAISRSTYSPLIQHLEELQQRRPHHPDGGPMDVDGAFNVFRRKYPETLTLIAEPQVAWQRASHSDLHSKYWHRILGCRTLLRPARKLKNFFRRSS